MAERKASDARKRNFATVVYPESAPEGWREILAGYFVPAFISPLHDKDINATGEPKKAHHHVMVMFEGKKSEEQVKVMFDSIGGVGLEKVESLRGYARYLCHLDNPEKHQYKPEEATAYGGADYPGIIGLAIDELNAVAEMMEFVDDYEIRSYAQLLRYARDHRQDWFRCLIKSTTVVMREYIKSNFWEVRHAEEEDDD